MEGLNNSDNLCEIGSDSHSDSVTLDGHEVGAPHLQLLSLSTSLLTQTEEKEVSNPNPIPTASSFDCGGDDTASTQKNTGSRDDTGTHERCCNCNSSLDGCMESSKIFNESIICQIFHRTSEKVMGGRIKIKDAWLTLCSIQNIGEDNALINSNDHDLVMCLTCVEILTKLFELYNEFITLSVRCRSVLAEVGDKVIKLLQKDVNFTSEDYDSKPQGKNRTSRKLVPVRKSTVDSVVEGTNSITSSKKPTKYKKKIKVKQKRSEDKCQTNVLLRGTGNSRTEKKLQIRRLLSHENQTIVASTTSDSSGPVETSHNYDYNLDESSDTCNRCGKRFKTFGGLKIHYASHVRDDKKVACKECGKKFKKLEALQMHERIDHKGFKPHKCPYEGCERSFRLKDKLKLHIKVMHEKNKPFPCPKCEKAFRTRYHLKAHDVAQHVQGDTTIGCTQCRRKFPSKDALETHTKTHEEEKRFVCSECHKGFKTSSRLKLHAKSHDALPSAVCSTCGKAYKHIRDLRLHEVIHEGESSYRFSCGDCPRKFYRIDLLRVHQSNEKHFSQEIVGPCVSKSLKSTKVSYDKSTKKLVNSNEDRYCNPVLNDDKETADVLRSVASSKRKRKQAQKAKTDTSSKSKNGEPLFGCLGSPALFPTMVPVDNVVDTSSGLEMVELSPTLINEGASSSLNRRNGQQDMTEQPSYILSTKDPVITNLVNTTNTGFSSSIPQTTNFSLSGQPAGNVINTVYAIKDSSDRSISSFSISAGAEQIGYDVINAFINNLN